MKRCAVWLVVVCGIAGYPVYAAEPVSEKSAAELLEENRALLRQNEELRARLAALERAAGTIGTEAAPEAPNAAEPAPVAVPPVVAEAPVENLDLGDEKGPPQELTLRNFFSAGWNEEFTKRKSEGRAPDLALLRAQTNFMEREFRLNYAYTNDIHAKTRENLTNLDYFIAWAFNRRLMIEVLGNYQWVDGREPLPDLTGQSARFVGRLQLISTENTSVSSNFQVISPDVSLGVHQTVFSYGGAAFEDLTRFGLYRVGLYGSVLFDSGAGPANTVGDAFFKKLSGPPANIVRNDVQYDISIAKTLTPPDTPLIGNFTVFLENFAQTNLDGNHPGRSVVTLTPGVRFNLGKLPGIKLGVDNWLMGGVDIPVAGPTPESAIYRFTYIKNF